MRPRRTTTGAATRPRRAGKAAASPEPIWTLRASEMRLYETFAGMAMMGILAAQGDDPPTAWVRRRSFRFGCEMAREAIRLRRKQSR